MRKILWATLLPLAFVGCAKESKDSEVQNDKSPYAYDQQEEADVKKDKPVVLKGAEADDIIAVIQDAKVPDFDYPNENNRPFGAGVHYKPYLITCFENFKQCTVNYSDRGYISENLPLIEKARKLLIKKGFASKRYTVKGVAEAWSLDCKAGTTYPPKTSCDLYHTIQE